MLGLGVKIENATIVIAATLFLIDIITNLAILLYLISIRGKNEEKFLMLSKKCVRNPLCVLMKSNLTAQRFQLFCYSQKWDEAFETMKGINLTKISPKKVLLVYLRCAIAMIHHNQLAFADTVLQQLRYRRYYEIALVEAMLAYHAGNVSGCVQFLRVIDPSKFDAYYMGFYNLYLGLTSEGERQKEYFDKARQSNSPTVIEYLDEILQKQNGIQS